MLVMARPAVAANPHALPDQYIVVFKDTVADPAGKARGLAAQHGLTLLQTYSHALKGFAAVVPPARLARLQADPDVAYINQDQVVTIDTQTLPTGINRIDGELSSTVSGNGSGSVDVDVAVIDTGIDLDHPDLNVVGGKNCSTGRRYDDGNGHGTHVAGTIAAKDDNQGVVGVAPNARLWAVRVLNNAGSGSWSSVICGVDWVTANASTIEVANMSLGGSGSEPAGSGCSTGDALHDAICRSVAAGVTYVVAAGNESDDAKNHVPAAYDEVITVSALADFNGQPGGGAAPTCRSDVDDTFADFSNYGADIDLIAPGVCILSTWKGGGYTTISGTSMATPHVAGAAALYKASHPGASPAQVKSALQSAGNLNWNNVDDPDGTKEVIVNVDAF
jgi:subtilisin family serine protease